MVKQIVACIDGSSTVKAVCDWAIWSSYQLNRPVSLLHVLDHSYDPGEIELTGSLGFGDREGILEELVQLDKQSHKLALEQSKHLLEAARQRVVQGGVKNVNLIQRHGNLLETLVEQADASQLMILGRQGQDSAGFHGQVGSQLESIIRTLQIPILIAQPEFKLPKKVMLAYDGSLTAQKALETVTASNLLQRRLFHLVMVGQDSEQKLKAAHDWLEKAGYQTVSALIEGDVETALWQYAEENEIDIMVMGAYGHSKVRQFFVGSNTAKMLASSKIPMVLLR